MILIPNIIVWAKKLQGKNIPFNALTPPTDSLFIQRFIEESIDAVPYKETSGLYVPVLSKNSINHPTFFFVSEGSSLQNGPIYRMYIKYNEDIETYYRRFLHFYEFSLPEFEFLSKEYKTLLETILAYMKMFSVPAPTVWKVRTEMRFGKTLLFYPTAIKEIVEETVPVQPFKHTTETLPFLHAHDIEMEVAHVDWFPFDLARLEQYLTFRKEDLDTFLNIDTGKECTVDINISSVTEEVKITVVGPLDSVKSIVDALRKKTALRIVALDTEDEFEFLTEDFKFGKNGIIFIKSFLKETEIDLETTRKVISKLVII